MKNSKSFSIHWRQWAVLVAAVFFAALTARLGVWQLSRAQEKQALQLAIDLQAQLPVLTNAALTIDPALWQQPHRRVSLSGQWLADKTVFLDNRPHHGQAGFWVMTPLRWADHQVVWVQRGWVARDPVDAARVPPVPTPTGQVLIEGRLTMEVSHMFELASSGPLGASGGPHIQANLDKSQMQSMVSDKVSAVVIQTDPDSEGLRRDWSVVAVNADKNTAYAFQWFALSSLITVLYVWFQWIRPFRHARK